MDLDSHLSGIVIGDAGAFGRWVAGAEGRLRLSLASFAAQVDCEAVLQEALLRIWQVAPRHVPDGQPNSLFRLAIRICRNLAIDEVRRTRREAPEPAPLPIAEPAAEPDPLLRRAIQDCRDKLGGKPAVALAARLAGGGLEARPAHGPAPRHAAQHLPAERHARAPAPGRLSEEEARRPGGADMKPDPTLVEAVASAYRARDPAGRIRSHPTWHDLDEDGRREAFEVTRQTRALEAALDPDGLSQTARAVLARIERRQP